MLEVLGQDYVRTARSKGISERAVVIHHALRNAWLPVVTMIGLEFGFLLGGVVVIETVFSYPGIGRLVFNAINQRDIPVVQAAVILLSRHLHHAEPDRRSDLCAARSARETLREARDMTDATDGIDASPPSGLAPRWRRELRRARAAAWWRRNGRSWRC